MPPLLLPNYFAVNPLYLLLEVFLVLAGIIALYSALKRKTPQLKALHRWLTTSNNLTDFTLATLDEFTALVLRALTLIAIGIGGSVLLQVLTWMEAIYFTKGIFVLSWYIALLMTSLKTYRALTNLSAHN